MYVDSITLAAVADELNQLVAGGRVQDVVAASELSFGLEVYANQQRRYLLISAEPKSARCHLAAEKFRRGVEQPSTIGLLIRKYVEGARLVSIAQPAWERILHFDFSGPQGDTRLIAEMMDQRSNLILTVEGEIVDSVKRIGQGENRARVILPRKPYAPPPPQAKIKPEEVSEPKIAALLRGAPDSPAWRVLVEHIAGVSPLAAREVIYRACEDSEAPAFDLSSEIVTQTFHAFIGDALAHRWSPCVVPAEDGSGIRAFAAYSLTHMGEPQPAESISAALAAYFARPTQFVDSYESSKKTMRQQIEAAAERIRRKVSSLERQAAKGEQIDSLRQQGELILAYATTIKARQTELVEQYDPDSPPLTIQLDPNRSAVENARQYFARYEKAKRAEADVPALKRAAEQEAAYLEQLATDLDLAESWPEIDTVREELQKAGYWQGQKTHAPQSGKPGFRRLTSPDGFVILIGRNAEQNHRLTTEQSKPDDLWLHARGTPGSHVIIRTDGRPIPEATIQQAAELAAYYSKARGEGRVDVIITERRYVKPIKGGRPGQVRVRQERVMSVRPAGAPDK